MKRGGEKAQNGSKLITNILPKVEPQFIRYIS